MAIASGNRRDIYRHPDPRHADCLGAFHLGDEGLFRRTDVAERIADHVAHGAPGVEDAEEIERDAQQVRRPHDGDFGVKPDDDRVGVVARVAPAPGDGIAHDHEAGELVDRVVHPARLEGGAVAAFVPARIRRRAVEHAVGKEERHAPPAAPEPDAAGAGDDEQAKPDQRVADGRRVAALHQLLHLLARDVGVIPLGCRKPVRHCCFGIAADEAVVAFRHHDVHARLRSSQAWAQDQYYREVTGSISQ